MAIAILTVAPWIVAGAIYFTPARPASVPDAETGPRVHSLASGPWGRLTALPIVVSPPVEYVSVDPSDSGAAWHLPGLTPEQAVSFLTAQGLQADQIAQLRLTLRSVPETKGVTVTPTLSLVRSLSPEVRVRLYSELGRVPLNRGHYSPFHYQAATADGWLGGTTITPETRALVEPLLYRQGNSLYFADLELLRGEIGPDEFLRLTKVLNRRATYVLRVAVKQEEVDALSDYWGVGGRRTDIRAVLESMSAIQPEQRLDIVHLLPGIGRDRMYRFPRITAADLDRPVIANCLWTALNFFSAVPDDKFLDVEYALATLKRDYYIVQNNFRLGDIIAFVDDNGSIFHAAVYLADDFVFTKNGTTPMAPWAIMRLDEIREVYRRRSEKPRLIVHRYEGY